MFYKVCLWASNFTTQLYLSTNSSTSSSVFSPRSGASFTETIIWMWGQDSLLKFSSVVEVYYLTDGICWGTLRHLQWKILLYCRWSMMIRQWSSHVMFSCCSFVIAGLPRCFRIALVISNHRLSAALNVTKNVIIAEVSLGFFQVCSTAAYLFQKFVTFISFYEFSRSCIGNFYLFHKHVILFNSRIVVYCRFNWYFCFGFSFKICNIVHFILLLYYFPVSRHDSRDSWLLARLIGRFLVSLWFWQYFNLFSWQDSCDRNKSI